MLLYYCFAIPISQPVRINSTGVQECLGIPQLGVHHDDDVVEAVLLVAGVALHV